MFSSFFRRYSLHEFHSKVLMANYGLTVQKGFTATTASEARYLADVILNPGEFVVKANVQTGGRGKGVFDNGLKGGVQICYDGNKVEELSRQMIGHNLVTKQTTAEGLPVKSVMVVEGIDIDKEFYLAILLDRTFNGPAIISSRKGGMDIEEVAATDPDAITVTPIDIEVGITEDAVARVASSFELGEGRHEEVGDQLRKLYKLFMEKEATQVEINPLATQRGTDKLYFVDAKINIDDDALARHADISEFQESVKGEEDPSEATAAEAGLNYVGLDGNIGCLVNGAGLAMGTMDIIKLHGGEPANFLDVGGSATVDQVKTAFTILSNHPKVKTVFINIFGGIMRCDIIAEGIVKAAQELTLDFPVVVRLAGTNSEKARAYLEKHGAQWNLHVADGMQAAARMAVQLTNRD